MIVDAEQRTKRLMRAPEARITASSEEMMMMTPTHYPVAWPSLGPWMRDLGWDAVQIGYSIAAMTGTIS